MKLEPGESLLLHCEQRARVCFVLVTRPPAAALCLDAGTEVVLTTALTARGDMSLGEEETFVTVELVIVGAMYRL